MGSGKGSNKWFWMIPLGCFGFVFLSCGGCILIPVIAVFSAVSQSQVFKDSMEKVQNDPRVVAELGEPIKMGWAFSGQFNTTNGEGNADFSYGVKGPKGSGTVEVEATSTDGEWTFHKLVVTANGKKIDLASAEGIVVEPERVNATEEAHDDGSSAVESTSSDKQDAATSDQPVDSDPTTSEPASDTGESAKAGESAPSRPAPSRSSNR
jgi:hypothetical protein